MDHFVDQGSLDLLNIKVFIPKKLNRKINLIGLNTISRSPRALWVTWRKLTVSTIARRGGHSIIPHNRNVWDFIIEMLIIQSSKHRLNVWVSKLHLFSPVDYL
jgi:hypothetical protein